MRNFLLITASLLLTCDVLQGQSLYRTKVISIADTTVIDSLSIVPRSENLYFMGGEAVPQNLYSINYPESKLVWLQKPDSGRVRISYQVFPLLFTKKYFHKDAALIKEEIIKNKEFVYQPPQKENTLFHFKGLNKSGSISRGVGFGNSQDLSVNSSLGLQLSGMLSSDIEITAAISDDNIPIQPEGRTQQLNEFDKVYIQLKRRNTSLTAGDFEISRPDSYFINFYKRTQGGLVSNSFHKNSWAYRTKAAAAVAKGRSARNSFSGIEGNQGPYRLTGNNGEQYIIIISGTERVFIDGELLRRGEENDYVMDYNTGEISFTPKRLITQNSRIIVEFEYSDKNYARTLTYFNQEAAGGKFAFRFNFYNEQDNPDQPFLQDLSEAQKEHLKGIGNQLGKAVFPNIDTVGFNTNEVLYKQVDTLGQQVFVYSFNPDSAKYRPGFSYVGPGNGDYKLSTTSAANGRVFEFIALQNGIKQGDYAPVTMLVTPKKQQLITFAADYQAGKNTLLSSEIAFSNNDVNLFSPAGNAENKGLAYRFRFKNELPLSKSDSAGLKLLASAGYEYAAAGFKAIERYRPVEFERDFNLNGLITPSAEHLAGFNIGLFKSEQKKLDYEFSSLIKSGQYSGHQQRLQGTYQHRSYQLSYSGSLLNSSSDLENGRFYRQKADLRRAFGLWSAGLAFEQEHNETEQKADDQLSPLSFAFEQYKLYSDYKGGSGKNFHFEYSRRYDRLPQDEKLENSSTADVYQFSYETVKDPNSKLQLTSSYRKVNYSEITSKQNENTLLGRADYQLNLWKGFANTTVFYEFGSGQEAKKEFAYLEVPAGQGAYTWNDYNQNGIKELDEFEIAKYTDQGTFVRIYRPSNEFVRVNYTAFNQSLRLTPALLLQDAAGFGKLLSKLSSQTAVKIDRRTAGELTSSAFNPFKTHIPEENLVSLNSFFRNTLFFNRNNPLFGLDLNFQQTAGKLLLLNGFDSRNRREEGLRLRWEVLKKTTLIVESSKGLKTYNSELFSQKNYHVRFVEVQPRIDLQFNADFRLSFAGGFSTQKNQIKLGGEKNSSLTLSTEARYHILKKGLLTSDINLINNSFRGTANSAIAYDMLNGLQSGKNLVFNAGFRHSLANGIQLNLNYQGRKSAAVNMIHRAGVEVRAFF